MSKKASEISTAEAESQENASVFDFLYYDSRRTGSFLAQFEEAGQLERTVQTDQVAKSAKRGFKFSLSGNVPLYGGGKVDLELPSHAGRVEGIERTYDPLWSNALNLLDFLESRSLIKRDISNANIGQFVLVQGSLQIRDYTLLKLMWDSPYLRSMAEAGIANFFGSQGGIEGTSAKERQRAKQEQDRLSKGIVDFVRSFPQTAQASVRVDDGYSVHCNIKPDLLVSNPLDLMLQHGVEMPGHWAILGVLDAKADELPIPARSLAENGEGGLGSALTSLLLPLAALVRQAGRPEGHYGVTPLLIFREVS